MRLSHFDPGTIPTRHPSKERGYVLVMFAMLLVPILLMVGFSVDVGSWYNRASNMRKAADAAALAGVVWLPDVENARTHAINAAGRNGIVQSDTVSIKVEAASEQRIRVTITDTAVGSYLWSGLGGRDITLTRTSHAEYTKPVPLGSPRNFIGTGLLLERASTGYDNEELFMSINLYCTDKVWGDRYQSSHFQNPPPGSGSKQGNSGSCNAPANAEYRQTGYETVIQAPVGRTAAIDVLLYDARYNDQAAPTGQTVTNCSAWQWPSTWTQVAHNGPRRLTVTEQTQYQRRTTTGSSGGTWQATTLLQPGSYDTANNYRYQYRTRFQTCATTPVMEDPIDPSYWGTFSEPFTYTLYGPDDTIFDHTDNPVICSRTFGKNDLFDYGPYLTSYRWNKLCTIPSGARSGDYVLRATNGGPGSGGGRGMNNYGVVARYVGSAGHGLCDGRSDDMCPRVHGRDALSVQASSNANLAEFYLAEIDREHDGKVLRISLFDPGEGGQSIEIMKPTGPNSWSRVTFDWASPGAPYGVSGTTNNLALMSGSNDRFNGRVLTLEVSLDDYDPPDDNNWWKISYKFSGTVDDRTTWQADVVGDPVHLVEDVPT